MSDALVIENLAHAYGEAPVLRGVDLRLARGDFMALIGPNGSGKTTLLRSLTGILTPQSGRIAIDGIDLRADPVAAKARLGLAIDPELLPGSLTGRQCLKLFANVRGIAEVPEESLALAQTLGFLPWVDRLVEEYSLGTRQKLGILLGLIGAPPLIVLDEPMNGLDPVSAWAIKQHLVVLTRERGCAVLLATHALEVAERFITRAQLLLEGRCARHWDEAQLIAIRHDPTRSLEQAMVEALRELAPTPTPA
jgi:ABC-2 type transport system ATP-binding protein